MTVLPLIENGMSVPPLRSRISCAIRVRARSRAVSSRTCAFSRRRGAPVMTSPCEPHGARLKEEQRRNSLYPGGRAPVNGLVPRRLVARLEHGHELIEVHRLRDVPVEAGAERLTH